MAELKDLYKAHQARRSSLREENEAHRKAALNAVGAFSHALLDSINREVAAVHATECNLEGEARMLKEQTQRFSKQTSQWLTTFDNFNASLKELGDVDHWAKTIQNDMQDIAKTLEYACNHHASVNAPPKR